ncbi:MAG: PEP-CTERM sorting domain-containing protein [Phenylobacterium sp.]|uniref:PEP-CTERM sorting domain-containing protein n=1 Tax=Phenylobacterium sp. TaxID=1871053 RepID=UPI001A5C045F|nr:PEP-CTERM sorting domain-containing protein [Phenylobacterium sp.]MBL8771216.1 PEP-CTERM sorting domain-containing protein [Phenylobacterium sp.]
MSASNLCGEGGCFSDTTRVLSRTWSASEFQGPLSISSLSIDKAMLGSMQDYAVRVSFVDGAGKTVANWGSYTLAVLSGDVVTLGGETVNWNTADGDLTLKLELLIPDKGGAGGGGFGGFGGFGGGGFATAPAFGGGDGPAGLGRLTSPQLPPPALQNMPALISAAVPEPGAWALMLIGFMGAGHALRSRRRAPLQV